MRSMSELAFSQQLCYKFRSTGTKRCDHWQIVTGRSKGRGSFVFRVKNCSIFELLHHDAEG